MGVDATTKWPSEGFTRRWPNVIRMSPPLNISKTDVDEAMRKLDAALARVNASVSAAAD